MEVRWIIDFSNKHFQLASLLFELVICIPGGGGDSHIKQTGMLVENFKFNP